MNMAEWERKLRSYRRAMKAWQRAENIMGARLVAAYGKKKYPESRYFYNAKKEAREHPDVAKARAVYEKLGKVALKLQRETQFKPK